MGTLRETENGPLLIAGAGVFPVPFDDEVAAGLEALFDVPLRAERACGLATLTLDGQEYSAWFESGIGLEVSFSVFRR